MILSIVGRSKNTKADKKQNRFGLAAFIISLIMVAGAINEITRPMFENGFSAVVSALIGLLGAVIIVVPIIIYSMVAKKAK